MPNLEFTRDLALIGAGYWGKNLVRNFHALGALHTICDPQPSVLGSYANDYAGVRRTTAFQDALRDPAITRIVIAAPAALHAELAHAALLAGKDTFVEKPLSLDEREAGSLVALAEREGLILMVGHVLHYHPCIQKLQALLAQGELGKLHYITSNRLNLGKIRREENALWSFAPHDISVILSLAGDRLPEQIRCTGEAYLTNGVSDTTLTALRFAGGIRAHIYVSWLNPFKEQKLTVVGSDGMAVFDDTRPWKEKLVLHRHYLTWANGTIPTPNKTNGEFLDVPESEPLQNECRHFLDCCRDRRTPRTDGQEGLRVLQILQAAQRSLDRDGEAIAPGAERQAQSASAPPHSPLSLSSSHEAERNDLPRPRGSIPLSSSNEERERVRSRIPNLPGSAPYPPSPISELPSPISNPSQRDYFAHPTAVIDDGAIIGKGTKIWHFSHIMKGAQIGASCVLGQNVNVDGGTRIGNRVKIQNNVSVYTGVELEDDVFLGPSCVLTNVSNPRSQINRHSLYEKTLIKRGATVGANATILCGLTIGRYAFIAAGAVVTKDVPDYALMIGSPARQKGWMSRHGHPLQDPNPDGIMVCPEAGLRYQLHLLPSDDSLAARQAGAAGQDEVGATTTNPQRSTLNPPGAGQGAADSLPSSSAPPSALRPPRSEPDSPPSLLRLPVSGARLRCLDLDEEAPLPPALATGRKPYDAFKA